MEHLLISYPDFREDEPSLIQALFKAGLGTFHIRKYSATEAEILDLLKRISSEFHDRVVLHHHHYLIKRFDLKGVHFNSYQRNIEEFPKKPGTIFSKAVHSLEGLKMVEENVDQVLLSPVFKSISKEGHEPSFTSKEIRETLASVQRHYKVFALGGVDRSKVDEVRDMGFDGVALKGAIHQVFEFKGEDAAVKEFQMIIKDRPDEA